MFKALKRKQKGGYKAVAESTGVKKPVLLPDRIPIPNIHYDNLQALPSDYNFPDGRTWGNPERVNERMNAFKKITSAAQLFPNPFVKYPAMALNSALGAFDIADDLKKRDDNNLALDLVGAAPLPDGAFIKSLGTGTRVSAKAIRAANMADAANIAGISADETDNFRMKKQKGGTQSAMPSPLLKPSTQSVTYNPQAYQPWGAQGQEAFDEGWMPTSSSQGQTTYYNRYGLLNSVNIPNDPRKGHLALIGHNNGSFDIQTQDADGKQFGEYMQRNGSAADARNYVTNMKGPVQQRTNQIEDGTNPDRYESDGRYTQLVKRQKGGREPIYTDNPKDRRLRVYNDSLKLYNFSEKMKKLYDNTLYKNSNGIIAGNRSVMKKIGNDNDNFFIDNERIKPIGSKTYDAFNDVGGGGELLKNYEEVANYKKPVQPVIYQPHKVHPQEKLVDLFQQDNTPHIPNLTGNPMNIKAYSMQGNQPVYGQSNALLGMMNGNEFYPDYHNTANRTAVNQQDSDVLNNPAALKEYLRRKGYNGNVVPQFGSGGINIKEGRRGTLRSALGVKEGDKIPASKLSIKEGDSPAMKRKKQFAINSRKFKH